MLPPLSLWSAAWLHDGSAVWKYVAGQLKSSSAETISSLYFLSFVYFKLQLGSSCTLAALQAEAERVKFGRLRFPSVTQNVQ